MTRHRGFTLIEVLVAISVFALVSAIAYAGLARVLKDREAVESERAFWRDFALTFRQLDEDFRFVRARGARDAEGNARPALQAGAGLPSGDDAVFELTRGGVTVSGNGRSDLQRVAYRLREGRLVRVSWLAPDRTRTSAALESTLLEGVEGLKLRFYNAKGEWVDAWPVPAPPGAATAGQAQAAPAKASVELPRGVEIALRFKQRGEFTRTFLVAE